MYIVDCSNSSLEHVPKRIPPETTHLLQDHNNISVLENAAFRNKESPGLPHLRVLSIKFNRLSSIQEGAFKGLAALEELYLYENDLNSSCSLPRSVFLAIFTSISQSAGHQEKFNG